MYGITYKWVGGQYGHYEVMVDGKLVETCDEGELNKVIHEIEEERKEVE